ncbi:hypothetical protein Q7P37_009708 [Cladosporium fusiforme]
MDWIGCLTLRMADPIITTGTFALLSLGAFYIEGWAAEHPLLPFPVLKADYVRPLLVGLLFNYGTIGIYMLYATLYIRNVIGSSPLQLVAWFAPMAIIGCALAIAGGHLMQFVSGSAIFIVTSIAGIFASLIFALAPHGVGFWNCVLPAMLLATISINLIFNRANVFLSAVFPEHLQGLAGGLSNSLIHLSIAIQLGFAKVVATETSYQGQSRSYKNAFYFAVACGAAALVVFISFVHVGKAEGEADAGEKDVDYQRNDTSDA